MPIARRRRMKSVLILTFACGELILRPSVVMVGASPGGSSDVAICADVAPLTDNHFDCCDLLRRSVIHYGACKILATIDREDQA
jgi:hypothetical protein